jgi:hypothetical protein
MNTTIIITQDDINKGKRGECSLCPVALAAQRAFPDKCPQVAAWNMYLDSSADVLDGPSITLPDEVREFIVAFDRGQSVSPFAFTIRVPE